jgi:hypothetical protein
MIRRVALIALATTCACSKIVGIDERSGDWCSLESGVRDFCATFDSDPIDVGWNGKLEMGGQVTRVPSDRGGSALHAVTSDVAVNAVGAATLGTSVSRASAHVRTGFDMRLVENTVGTPDKNLKDGYVAIFSVNGSNGSMQLALRKDGLYIVSFLTAEAGPPMLNGQPVPVLQDMTRLSTGTRVMIEIHEGGDTTVTFDGVPVLRKINTGAALVASSPTTAFALGLYVLGPSGPLDATFDNFTFELLP